MGTPSWLLLAIGGCALTLVVVGVLLLLHLAANTGPAAAPRRAEPRRIAEQQRRLGGVGGVRRRAAAARDDDDGSDDDASSPDEDAVDDDGVGDAGGGAHAGRRLRRAVPSAMRRALRRDRNEAAQREADAARRAAGAIEDNDNASIAAPSGLPDEARWREEMVVEEIGEGRVDEGAILSDLLNAVKTRKVVVLEELAAEFSLRTADVLSRIGTLEAEGRLSGVVDDRGKYIAVDAAELEALASFIEARGRVSVVDVAAEASRLVAQAAAAAAAV